MRSQFFINPLWGGVIGGLDIPCNPVEWALGRVLLNSSKKISLWISFLCSLWSNQKTV